MKLNEMKVLILDDSPVAISMTRSILARIGFKEDFIFFSQSPKTGIAMAQREKYDVLICDYNFNTTLDGRQVLEELEHFNCISSSSIFMLVTGDASLQTVNSMMELTLDDYVVKPFNMQFLKTRVIEAIKRKRALEDIYVYKKSGEFEKGLEACDNLLPFHSKYRHTISYEKGIFLKRLQLWEESADYYSALSLDDSSQWVQLGLSNSLRHLGKADEAKEILNKIIIDSPHSMEARKQLALIEAESMNIPESIKHLEIVKSLTKGSSERELALSNLCLASGDYDSAYKYYKTYFAMSKDTFRNNEWMKLNLLRRSLLQSEHCGSSLNNEAEPLLAELVDLDKGHESYGFSVQAVIAHTLIIKREYKDAITILNNCFRVLKTLDRVHFYDIHYFVSLLLTCSFDSEFLSLLPRLKDEYLKQFTMYMHDDSYEVVINSMDMMLKSITQRHNDKSKWLVSQHKELQDQSDHNRLMSYIAISKRYPTLVTVRFNIISLLCDQWPQDYGRTQTRQLLSESGQVISALPEQLGSNKGKYKDILALAEKATNKKRDKKLARAI